MYEIIALWTLRYGPEDTLREVARGLVKASNDYSDWTAEGKYYMSDAGADVAHIANQLVRKQREAEEAGKVNG